MQAALRSPVNASACSGSQRSGMKESGAVKFRGERYAVCWGNAARDKVSANGVAWVCDDAVQSRWSGRIDAEALVQDRFEVGQVVY